MRHEGGADLTPAQTAEPGAGAQVAPVAIETLRHPRQFRECFRRGRMVKNRFVVLHALHTKEPVTRVGFSVSRKLGKAVARNRVKRRLREAVREANKRLPSGYDLVFSARVRCQKASYGELTEAVEQALSGIGGRKRSRRAIRG